jgi:hypothetical protein
MTNNKDLNYVEQLKAQLNIPKTETRIILNDWQTKAKTSKLSAAARNKVVNHNKPYQSQNQESYGPCSYHNCNRSTPFDLNIGIEGCKWWATNYNTSLPGYWNPSPTGSYYWRERLESHHIGHAYDADSLIGRNNLYTVNTVGLYAVEDDEFRRGAQNFIREHARIHEQGYPINESTTLLSSTTSATKWTVRIAGSVAATTFLGPAGAAGVGAGTWMIGKGAQELCENEKAKLIWGTVKDVGSDSFLSGVSGSIGEIVNTDGLYEWKKYESKGFDFIKGCADSSVESVIQHKIHLASGRNYDSECLICNP